jgi:hypothetical protein
MNCAAGVQQSGLVLFAISIVQLSSLIHIPGTRQGPQH